MKTLVLVRHAHRDTANPAADNGLTAKGREQADAVRRLFKERFGKKDALLLSSPKKRCLQTLGPLAEAIGVPVRVDERLREGYGLAENAAAFAAWWREAAPDRLVACSHGDWIPYFLGLTAGVGIALKKGGWAELSLTASGARLAFLEQEPDA